MWELQAELPAHLRNAPTCPPLTYDWIFTIALILILLNLGVKRLLASGFGIVQPRLDSDLSTLEYSPLYHLLIIILVLGDLDWNTFDLAVWTLTFVGIATIRKALHSIRLERQALLNGYAYDTKLVRLLGNSRTAGAGLLVLGVVVFVWMEKAFMGLNMKVVNLLVFPPLMLVVDAVSLWLCSWAVSNDLLCYYNQNINEIQPTYKLELIEKIAGSSVRVWHYYNLIRVFFKLLLFQMGLLDYLWIFSVLNSCFQALKTLVSSFSKYRNYNKLMRRFDRLFRTTTSAPDQTCTICLSELLNCRRLSSCGHLFHYKCLFQWVQNKLECPVCRVAIQIT